jgi:outer membrane protein assembly factor BamB
VLAAGKLVTLGISGILSCWDADSGQRLWQRRFESVYSATSPLYGTATSPLVLKDMCIVHVGGHDSGALTAFNLQSGETIWKWAEDGPAYTSPIITTLAGKTQLVTQSQEHCLGVDPAGGELLWKFRYTTQYTMNIATPVRYRDLVIFSGYRRGTTAYRIAAVAGKWTAEQAWHNPDVSMFMSSPVLVGDQLYAFAQERAGQLVCMDPGTGRVRWRGPARAGENAALVAGGGVLFMLTTGSELIVLRPNARRYTELARYRVAGTPTWAHPAIAGSRIVVKDREHLILWEMPQR